jgi:hypothetical protein
LPGGNHQTERSTGCAAEVLMFKRLVDTFFARSGTRGAPHAPPAGATHGKFDAPPPTHIEATGAMPLALKTVMREENGFPVPDWDAIRTWLETLPDNDQQGAAWGRCELAWLQHLRAALGDGYRLRVDGQVALLSSQDDVSARATLTFVNRARQRIVRTLEGLAEVHDWGYDVVVVFDDHDTYYRYAANHYPDDGEFALSSGMYLGSGCGHFVTVKDQLDTIEPVIVHELTHALLDHLPIPVWLNEGLAVNTEQRFYPQMSGAHRGGHDAAQRHARHQRFWGPAEIQQFWSGDSFHRPDEGNELSYDLARILTAQFAADWPRFRNFANTADSADGGAAAARAHLELELGRAVCALLEREYTAAHEPEPMRWKKEAKKLQETSGRRLMAQTPLS